MIALRQCFRILGTAALALTVAAGLSSARAQTPTKISIALAGGELVIFAPILVAVGSKAFEKRGIQAELQSFGGGVPSFAALVGGSTEFGLGGPGQVLAAASQGRDVVGMFNMFHGGAVVFMGPKKYEQSRGRDLKKYDGSTWAYTAEGATSQIFMTMAAQSAGLDWNKQGRLPAGGVDAFIPALESGRADLITMDMTSAAKAIKLGIGYPVLNTDDAAEVEHIWGRQLGLPLSTTRTFINKNPKVTQDVADAMREGLLLVQKYANDPATLYKLMPASFREANKEEDFRLQWELAKPAFANVDGTFSDKAIADTLKFVKGAGQKGLDNLDVSKYLDNTWAKKAIENVPSVK